jgi:hypothetical protein
MSNDEVLVNDRFAVAHGLKIGDKIKLNDFIIQEEDQEQYQALFTPFAKEYTIVG